MTELIVLQPLRSKPSYPVKISVEIGMPHAGNIFQDKISTLNPLRRGDDAHTASFKVRRAEYALVTDVPLPDTITESLGVDEVDIEVRGHGSRYKARDGGSDVYGRVFRCYTELLLLP